MEQTYAYLLRLRANEKTALFRATPLPIVLLFEFLFFSWVQAAVGGIAK